jgi:rhodanese-related sulfurtransferase
MRHQERPDVTDKRKQRSTNARDAGENGLRMAPSTTGAITARSTMREILEKYPSARRALFQRYHIGGCDLCSYDPGDTLMATLQRHAVVDALQVLQYLERADQLDRRLRITPKALAGALWQRRPPQLVDVRSLEEWSVRRIEGARPFTSAIARRLSRAARRRLIVFYCQTGPLSLDVATYFSNLGFANVRWLMGGLDAWCRDVGDAVLRSSLDSTTEDHEPDP